MTTARVITGWNGTGTAADPYRPAVADDHPPQTWFDQSGNAPNTGPYTVQAVFDDATFTALQADPKYTGKVTVVAS
jgi:hypothetical protein